MVVNQFTFATLTPSIDLLVEGNIDLVTNMLEKLKKRIKY